MPFNVKGALAFDRSFADAVNFLDRADDSGRATRRFLSEFKTVKGYVSAFPFLYAIRKGESRAFGDAVRAVRIGNFLACYVVDEKAEEVVFYYLRHVLSDPEATDWSSVAGE